MAMNMGQQLLGSVSGNIEKGLLIIDDYRAFAKEQQASFQGKQGNALKKNLKTQSMLMKTAKNQAFDHSLGMTTATEKNKQKVFKVQFNPSEINMFASASTSSTEDATGGQVSNDPQTEANLTMEITLYFDEVNIYDCFMFDKFSGGMSAQGVKNAAAAIQKNFKGKVWTVQDEVEGLVAALRDPYTRTVTFRWADFCFIGDLSTIYADYTMFSTEGKPVRARVRLRIVHLTQRKYLNRWYKEFDSYFATGSNSLTKPGQKMGNAMNLNI